MSPQYRIRVVCRGLERSSNTTAGVGDFHILVTLVLDVLDKRMELVVRGELAPRVENRQDLFLVVRDKKTFNARRRGSQNLERNVQTEAFVDVYQSGRYC